MWTEKSYKRRENYKHQGLLTLKSSRDQQLMESSDKEQNQPSRLIASGSNCCQPANLSPGLKVPTHDFYLNQPKEPSTDWWHRQVLIHLRVAVFSHIQCFVVACVHWGAAQDWMKKNIGRNLIVMLKFYDGVELRDYRSRTTQGSQLGVLDMLLQSVHCLWFQGWPRAKVGCCCPALQECPYCQPEKGQKS